MSRAPTEEEAHRSLRSLWRRLRYRSLLGDFGWVLHRQKNLTLHYHGIAHMPYMDDDLKEWRKLLKASGFGVQNKLEEARAHHAEYCSRYISRRLADVAPLKRAYSFSQGFPRPSSREDELEGLYSKYGLVDADAWMDEIPGFTPQCVWRPPAIWRD